MSNKNQNNLSENSNSCQIAKIPSKGKILDTVNGTDKMNMEQLNEHLVKRAGIICEYARKKRTGHHTSDILPPICSIGMPLHRNIDNILACFSSTLSVALSSESKYIKLHKDFRDLSIIVDSEKELIFEFFRENGLQEKFYEFVDRERNRKNEKNNYLPS